MTTTSTDPSTLTDLIDEHLATWSETDADERMARIRAVWATDGAIVDPPLDGHGHVGIDALMTAMQEHYPDHRFVRVSDIDTHHDSFRVAWELRGPDGAVALTGMDVGMLAADGKLQRISGFFGELAR